MLKKRFVIGADVGGTFTDVVAVDESGNIWTAKAPTTPGDPAEGVTNGVEKVAAAVGTAAEEIFPRSQIQYTSTLRL